MFGAIYELEILLYALEGHGSLALYSILLRYYILGGMLRLKLGETILAATCTFYWFALRPMPDQYSCCVMIGGVSGLCKAN